MRRLLVFIWLGIILIGISGIFWYTDWQYSLPTPPPLHYTAVKPGTFIDIDHALVTDKSKPVLLHFFNPSCPCSRFNMEHFQSLVKKYHDKVNFAMVVMSKSGQYTAKDIQDKYNLNIPVSFDTTLAANCGVYSTPQAVLLTSNGNLYYRGNYNKSRYCTARETSYAQIAIDSLLDHNSLSILDKSAFVPYGCQLPTCRK